jgi:hypothetical protein
MLAGVDNDRIKRGLQLVDGPENRGDFHEIWSRTCDERNCRPLHESVAPTKLSAGLWRTSTSFFITSR